MYIIVFVQYLYVKLIYYWLSRDSYDKPDINYMVYSKIDHLLYAGCGDNNIYIVNLEDGRILRSLQGHTDYIHCLAVM